MEAIGIRHVLRGILFIHVPCEKRRSEQVELTECHISGISGKSKIEKFVETIIVYNVREKRVVKKYSKPYNVLHLITKWITVRHVTRHTIKASDKQFGT